MEWQPIETFRASGSGLPQYAIIFADGQVGEAVYRPTGDSDEGWWWANTSPGDYHAEKIEGWAITHWMKMPEPPTDVVDVG